MLRIKQIGYGMGTKEFPAANCVRAMWGETEDSKEVILELSCNIDDMTAEEIGFALEHLIGTKALDVYTTAIGMKKSRPGICLHVLCYEKDATELAKEIFLVTTTLGIRAVRCMRYVLERSTEERQSLFGIIRKKLSSGYGVKHEKWEYEDVAQIARSCFSDAEKL